MIRIFEPIMPGRPIEKAIRAIEVICTSFNVNSLYFKSVIKIGSDNIIRPSIVGKEISIPSFNPQLRVLLYASIFDLLK